MNIIINKKLIITLLIIIVMIFFGVFLKKEYLIYKSKRQEQKYEAKFQELLAEAIKIPDSYWDKKYKDMPIKNKYKVVLFATNGGEYSHVEYFKYAAERMGWNVRTYYYHPLGHEEEILQFDPDFMIFSPYIANNFDMKLTAHRSKKYLECFISFYTLRNLYAVVSKENTYDLKGEFTNAVSLSHGIFVATNEAEVYRGIYEKMQKPFNGIRTLPLLPALENKPAEAKNLMWIGMGWDNFRSSDSYKEFINVLSQEVPMKVYGSYKIFSYLKPGSYDGYIPPGMANIDAIRKNGIYLLTHSDWHFKGGEPSMRLFEATAANVIIISDKHPFVIENFGDNVLYFDNDLTPKEMSAQIKKHMDWIQANPEKAKAMADRAHQISLKKFALEDNLLRIAKMHEFIVKEEKKMKLSFPLSY
jgi:hypothetical protein